MPRIEIHKLQCKRCGHTWIPRKDDVRICPNPKCHSAYWDKDMINKPRQNKDLDILLRIR